MNLLEKGIEKVRAASHKKDDMQALALANDLVKQYPVEMRVLLLRSHIYARMREYADAIDDCTRAIEIEPSEPCLFFNRSRYRIIQWEFQGAIDDCTLGLAACDSHQDNYYRETLHFFRACAYVRLRMKQEAIVDLNKVQDGYRLWVDKLISKEMLLAECECSA